MRPESFKVGNVEAMIWVIEVKSKIVKKFDL